MDNYSWYALSAIVIAVISIMLLDKDARRWLLDPFNIGSVIKGIDNKASILQRELHYSHAKLDNLHTAVQKYEELYKDYKLHKLVMEALDDAAPDMMWAKDLCGRYLLANKQIRDNLLFDPKPYGKTDLELAIARKRVVGDRNHTFGEVCGDSDTTVLEHKEPMRFVEWGTVSGQLMVLEVHKNIIRDTIGEVIGTCGIARDITDEYSELRNIAESTPCEMTKQKILKVIDKYKFENKDYANG